MSLICFILGLSFSAFGAQELPIIKIGHPTLRQVAKEVNLDAIQNPAFQALIDNMVHTMKKAGGIGLAAPQVNESLRMFVMKSGLRVPLTVVINPTLEVLPEEGKQNSVEGCLSIPGRSIKVSRFKKIRLSYWDRHGNYKVEEAHGIKAIISQHEYDHLNGVLIVDIMEEYFSDLDFEKYVNAPLM